MSIIKSTIEQLPQDLVDRMLDLQDTIRKLEGQMYEIQEHRNAAIYQAHKDGAAGQHIADALGMSRMQIYRIVRDHKALENTGE